MATLQDKARHLIDHFKAGVTKSCNVCSKEFDTVEVYLKHLRTHGNCCYLCGKPVRGPKVYVTHLMTHLKQLLGHNVNFKKAEKLPVDPKSKNRDLKCPHCQVCIFFWSFELFENDYICCDNG